ncbi:alpha/beta hydrolase [Parabacteroides sp. OttesenSCG-928-N08]|nr:alpha/beta hydrolase [Parabacteroides sp. OttesenSCG-928-N08]
MKRLFLFLLPALLLTTTLHAQFMINEEPMTLQTATGDIQGTLRLPDGDSSLPVAIIIGGSGPTDRDGNQPGMTGNSLKMLAEELYRYQIATLCFDKRGIAASKGATKSEEELRFEHYIDDVKAWIEKLSGDKRFSSIHIIGHSEGALIGLVAAKNNKKVAKYISLAGMGVSMDELLKEQLSTQLAGQPESMKEQVFGYIDEMKQGKTVNNVPVHLQTLFRPSVQPYLISCFRYDPRKEIAQLTIPALIVNGTTDIQVSVEQAERLAKAQPKAKKLIIDNMNHVLKQCDTTDKQKQLATYTNGSLPIRKELVKGVAEFLKGK